MRYVGFAFLLIGMALPVVAAEWRNTAESRFTFEVAFEGVPTRGEFREFEVELDFDPARPELGKLRVTVNLKAVDMGDPDMNDVLFDPAWLDVAQFTEAVFVSDVITAQAPGKFVATGTLDLKGTKKVIPVSFSWTGSPSQATLRGNLVLQRTAFEVGSGEWASGDAIGIDVKLDFTVQLLPKE